MTLLFVNTTVVLLFYIIHIFVYLNRDIRKFDILAKRVSIRAWIIKVNWFTYLFTFSRNFSDRACIV